MRSELMLSSESHLSPSPSPGKGGGRRIWSLVADTVTLIRSRHQLHDSPPFPGEGLGERWPRATHAALALLLLLLLITQFAHAWSTYPDLPSWMHRGNMRWISGGASTQEQAQALADQGVNLLWGGFGTSDPKLIDFMVGHGIHRTTYICSTSIFWDPNDPKNIFNLYPPLKNGTAMEADGTRKLLYANPLDRDGTCRRFGGCRLSPEWIAYQKHRMTFYAEGGQPFPNDPVYKVMQSDPQPRLDVFFFDNPFVLKCYCPVCQDAWAKVCKARFGTVVPDPEKCADERVRNAWDYFWLDVNARYMAEMKAYANGMNPPRFTSPNLVSGYPEFYYLIEHGKPDSLLIELGGGGERPWGHSEFAYKSAMAASDGKAMSNIWCFPAARPRVDYRKPALPFLKGQMPESSYLTAAEAVACQATYLSSGPPEFGKFVKRYNRIYGDAQPAAKVALVYSTATELWRRRVYHVDLTDFLGPQWWIGMDFTPAAHVKHLGDRLSELGVPYDVLVERQLNAKELAQYDCVILPDVQCIGPEAAKALNEFVKHGKSVIVGEQFAVRDEEGNPLTRDAARKLGGSLSTANRIISIQPDQMKVDGFIPDGNSGRIMAAPSRGAKTATAWVRLTADMLPAGAGPFRLRAQVFDASIGEDIVRMKVNGRQVASLILNQQSDEYRWMMAEVGKLREGDVIGLEAESKDGELCRIQEVRIEADAVQKTVGKKEAGAIVFTPDALESLNDKGLQSLLEDASAFVQHWRGNAGDDVYINFLHPANSKALALHVLNSTVTDNHGATLLDAPACMAKKTVVLTAAQRAAMGKPVVSVLGFTPDWMQTYMTREVGHRAFSAKEDTKAWLVVNVNGKEAGRLALGKLADGWTDVPVDPKLLRDANEVVVKVDGDVGYRRSYYGLLIDPAGKDDSRWTPAPWAEGKPVSKQDLSPYDDEQAGSYMIVVHDAGDKTALPAYEAKHRAVDGVTVTLPATDFPTPVGMYISPELDKPVPLQILKKDKLLLISLPKVDIYGVALVANSADELQELLK